MSTKNALVLRDYLTKTKEEIVSSFVLTSQMNNMRIITKPYVFVSIVRFVVNGA